MDIIECEQYQQCGNGGAAMGNGNHSSQRPGGGAAVKAKAALTRATKKGGKGLTPAEQAAWDAEGKALNAAKGDPSLGELLRSTQQTATDPASIAARAQQTARDIINLARAQARGQSRDTAKNEIKPFRGKSPEVSKAVNRALSAAKGQQSRLARQARAAIDRVRGKEARRKRTQAASQAAQGRSRQKVSSKAVKQANVNRLNQSLNTAPTARKRGKLNRPQRGIKVNTDKTISAIERRMARAQKKLNSFGKGVKRFSKQTKSLKRQADEFRRDIG